MTLPKDIREYIEGSFLPEHWEEARCTLEQARIEDGTLPGPRLLRCAIVASRGNMQWLQHFASLLAMDWRDVILAGEYEFQDAIPVQVRDLSQPLQA